MRISKQGGSNNNTRVSSESRIFGENWVIEWPYAAFSLLFNVYIRSMHVKLLQLSATLTGRGVHCVLGASIVFKSFSEFPNLFPFIICTPLLSSPSLSRKQRLVRSGCGLCNRAFYVIDCMHARFRTSPWSGSGRSVSNLCSCFRCIAKVFVLRVPALNLSLLSHTDALGTLQPVVIIKIVWRFGSF